MKKTEVAKAIVSATAGIAMAVMVGQIMPVNLQSVSKDLSIAAVSDFFYGNDIERTVLWPLLSKVPSVQVRCAVLVAMEESEFRGHILKN